MFKFRFSALTLLIVMMAVLLAAAVHAGDTRYFVPNGNQTTNTDYVVPTITNPSKGFLPPATATFDIPASIAVRIPDLPAGTKRFRVYVQPGAGVNVGPANVASGTTYPEIASDTLSDYFHVGTTTPTIYLIGRTAGASGTLICE